MPLRADGFQDFLATRFDDLLINAALIGREFAERNLLQLRGQIRRDVFLQAPQEERPQPAREPLLRFDILLLRDGQFVTLAEILGRAEIAGHEKVEDGPQIEHGVFQRRAGKHEPMLRPHGFHRLRVLRLAILDVLGFVEHHGVELDLAILLRIAPNQRIARHYDVARRNSIEQCMTIRSA
jgi:hypothetical protein